MFSLGIADYVFVCVSWLAASTLLPLLSFCNLGARVSLFLFLFLCFTAQRWWRNQPEIEICCCRKCLLPPLSVLLLRPIALTGTSLICFQGPFPLFSPLSVFFASDCCMSPKLNFGYCLTSGVELLLLKFNFSNS